MKDTKGKRDLRRIEISCDQRSSLSDSVVGAVTIHQGGDKSVRSGDLTLALRRPLATVAGAEAGSLGVSCE